MGVGKGSSQLAYKHLTLFQPKRRKNQKRSGTSLSAAKPPKLVMKMSEKLEEALTKRCRGCGYTHPTLMNQKLFIWLAALIDGEGSISLSATKKKDCSRGFRWRTWVQIRNNNLTLIKIICCLTKTGTPNRQKGKGKRKESFCWRGEAQFIREILPKILPYLIIKRRQAQLIIQATQLLSKHRAYHTPNDEKLRCLYLKLHELNLAKNTKEMSPWVKNK